MAAAPAARANEFAVLQIAGLTGDNNVSNADIQGLINFLANGGGSGGTALVTCSPKTDPGGMRVYWPDLGKETLDERQEAQAGADHSEAA